jgi:hypothetical protein
MSNVTFAQSAILDRIDRTKCKHLHVSQYGDSLYDDYSDWVEYTESYDDYHDYLDGGSYLDNAQ